MALPRIRVDVDADTSGAEAGLGRVEDHIDRVGTAATITGGRVGHMSTRFRGTIRDSRAFGRGIQNAAFQLGDFATQVGAGTSASIALGQQLPQLFVGFGALGAVIGAVVAIAVPLSRSFAGLTSDTQTLNNVLGVTAPMFEAIGASLVQVRDIGVQFAELLLNNFDRLVIIAGVAAAAFGARLVAGFVAARLATMTLAGSLLFLRSALIRTGIGALIVGVGELVYQFSRLSRAAGGVGEAIAAVGATFREFFSDRIPRALSVLSELFEGVGMMIQGAFMAAFEVVQTAFTTFINTLIGGINSAGEALNSLSGGALGFSPVSELDNPSDGFSEGANLLGLGRAVVGSAAGSIRDIFNEPLESVQNLRDLLASIRDEEITLSDLLGLSEDEDENGGGGAVDRLDEELTAQEERIREHFNRIKALTEGGLSDKLGAWGNYFNNLANLTQSGNDRLLKIGQAFASAQALVDTWSAFTQVLRDPYYIGRPWARVAAAGQVLAAGIGAVNAIRNVGPSGGGVSGGVSGGAGGGSAGMASAGGGMAASQQVSRNVAIQLTGGDLYSRDQVIQLINSINEAVEDGAIVRLV